ncbi:MAG: MOSC domain-containing protein [Paraglaciecola sp.]|nr:MOSC domain-containing protein [Paraglaciecola sp.]
MKITGLYQAKVKRIGAKNERTGIYKYPVKHAVIDELGIQGDVQVDKRYHGGPERALHQYALTSYEKIIKAYPLLHKQAWPGSIGENLSVADMNETNVCIGDIYQMGGCQIQVSGPRMPCYKISAKFKTPGLDKFIAKHAIHGWYFRVLKNGSICMNDPVILQQRPNPEIDIQRFLLVVKNKSASVQEKNMMARAIGLDPEWRRKLS